jgi:hypothetical protein
MALKLDDRARETAAAPGTGSFTLAGAVQGFQSFASFLSTGDTTWYKADNGTAWEVGLGTFTPPSTLARTTIYSSSNADAVVNFATGTLDIACDLPAVMAEILNLVEAPLASAATTNLGAVQALRTNITGTTAITSFGTGANKFRVLRFSSALTLTHNATTLILPGSTNIVTAAGDIAIVASDPSGNWRCLQYFRAANGPDAAALKANNLSDLASPSSARTNLGLGTAAVKNTGTSGDAVPLLTGGAAFAGAVSAQSAAVTGNVFVGSYGTPASYPLLGVFAGLGSGTAVIGQGLNWVSGNTFNNSPAGGGWWSIGSPANTPEAFAVYTSTQGANTAITFNRKFWIDPSSYAVNPGGDNNQTLGAASFRWSQLYAGTTTINTSAEDEKTNFADISDDLLLAALDTPVKQFQWKDSVERKGAENARWHIGPTAEGFFAACKRRGVDPYKTAIYCEDPELRLVARKVDRLVMKTRTEERPEIEIRDGVPVLIMKSVEVPVIKPVQVVDEHGEAVEGLFHDVPQMKKTKVDEMVQEPTGRTVKGLRLQLFFALRQEAERRVRDGTLNPKSR